MFSKKFYITQIQYTKVQMKRYAEKKKTQFKTKIDELQLKTGNRNQNSLSVKNQHQANLPPNGCQQRVFNKKNDNKDDKSNYQKNNSKISDEGQENKTNQQNNDNLGCNSMQNSKIGSVGKQKSETNNQSQPNQNNISQIRIWFQLKYFLKEQQKNCKVAQQKRKSFSMRHIQSTNQLKQKCQQLIPKQIARIWKISNQYSWKQHQSVNDYIERNKGQKLPENIQLFSFFKIGKNFLFAEVISQQNQSQLQKVKYEFPIVGLENLGNTCYMNASLQCLIHSQSLAKYLLQPSIQKKIRRPSKANSQIKVTAEFIILLEKLIKNHRMNKSRRSYQQPISFKNALSKIFTQYQGKNQQDSYGLCLNIMITLHQALNQNQSRKEVQKHFLLNKFSKDLALQKFKNEYFTAHSSIITELFSCIQLQRNTCNKCGSSYLYLDTHNIWKIPSHVSIKQKPSLEIMIIQNLVNFKLNEYQYEENKFQKFGQLCKQITKTFLKTDFDSVVFMLNEIQKFKSGYFQRRSQANKCQLVDETDMKKPVRDMLKYMEEHKLSLTVRKLEKSEKKQFVPIRIRHGIFLGDNESSDPFTPAFIFYADPNQSAYDFWVNVEKLEDKLKYKPNKKYESHYTIVQSKILNLNFQNPKHLKQQFSLAQTFPEIKQKTSQQIKMSQHLKSPQITQFLIFWNFSHQLWQGQFELQRLKQKNDRSVINKVKLADCFKQYQKQIQTGNQLYCQKCDRVTDHKSHKKIYQTSNLLIIVLDRFKQTMHGCVKDDTIVEFDMQIDLTGIVQNPSVPSQKSQMHDERVPSQKSQMHDERSLKYSLYGVVNHSGSLYSGHYYAYCRDMQQQKWYVFNDSKVSPINKNQVVNNKAYILFYQRKDLQK